MDPNEELHLRNKKTGAVTVIKRSELPKYGFDIGYTPKIDAQMQMVKSGQLDFKKLADTDPQTAAFIQSKVGASQIQSEKKLTADEQKKSDSYRAITNLIKNLENNYQEAGGAGFGNGPSSRIMGAITGLSGQTGFNDAASVYEKQRKGFAATLKELTGDTGVLTDQDFARLVQLLPELGATPGEAKKLLNDLRSQLSAKYGGELTQTSINPKTPGKGDLGPLNFLIPVNTAQDIGTGLRNILMQPSLQKNLKLAEGQSQQAMQVQDPVAQKQMLEQANRTFTSTGNEAGDIGQSFSPDVQQNPLFRALTGAAQIGMTANSVASLPKVASGIKGGVDKMIHPLRTAGEQRAAAIAEASGKTISGDKVISALEEGSSKVSPTAKAGYDRFLEQARNMYKGKNLTVQEAVDLNSAANDAYTAAGKVGKASTAKFNKVLGDVLKSELKINAPAVSKANELFKFLYSFQNIGKKYAPSALVGGAASVAGGVVANKVLHP